MKAISTEPKEAKGEDITKRESPTRELRLTSEAASQIRDDVAYLRGLLLMMGTVISLEGDLQTANYADWVIHDAVDHVMRLEENLKGVEDII